MRVATDLIVSRVLPPLVSPRAREVERKQAVAGKNTKVGHLRVDKLLEFIVQVRQVHGKYRPAANGPVVPRDGVHTVEFGGKIHDRNAPTSQLERFVKQLA